MHFVFIKKKLCKNAKWQKEASDIPSKSELLMFLYFTFIIFFLPGQILCINTHPAKRHHDIPLTSVEMTDTFCYFTRNVTLVTYFLLTKEDIRVYP